MLYHPNVLGQLLWLREALNNTHRTDRFLLALLLGALHANYIPGSPPRGLSISMSNTFSMSAGYVRRYIQDHGLVPPKIDVFDLLEAKLKRIHLPPQSATRGHAWCQDARDTFPDSLRERPAKLVFTSPPYLSVIKYGKYNWVRLWMLKQSPKAVDNRLVATSSLLKSLQFMQVVIDNLYFVIRDDGFLCLVIGDVRNRETGSTINLAERVWKEVAHEGAWYRLAIINDRLPAQHKVSRIWKNSRGNATKTDRILVLAKCPLRGGELPMLGRIQWQPATHWA
jgi:site-specific DNA-methyltransferase (adenine-specific)